MPRRLPLLAAACLLQLGLAVQPASAQDEEALAACGTVFDQCMARCETSYPDDEAAEAGCKAACAADRAVCEAKAGYEAAKPWVEEQFRSMQRFFEGFSERGRTPPAMPHRDPDPEEPLQEAPPEETLPEAEEPPVYKDI